MSTPTGENTNELPEQKSHAGGDRLASDLGQLEALIALHVREQWAPQFPRAAQMPSVPDLTRARERLDNDDPPPPWLKPEHRIIPPAIMRCRQRASRRWQNGILIAFIISVCVPPMAYYFVGGRQSSSETHRQAASIVTKPAVPLASLNAQILAQDDEAEPLDANQSASPAKPSRAAGFSERLAMVKPEDADVGPMSPKPVVRFLDVDAITLLMKQGERLVETGDFAAARTLFQRAAEADDAPAAIALGATYDPTVLAQTRAVGIDADVVKARFWYQKAAGVGSLEAKRRLESLANW